MTVLPQYTVDNNLSSLIMSHFVGRLVALQPSNLRPKKIVTVNKFSSA